MKITVNEAGRFGGLKTLGLKGREFYSQIGKKGQISLRIKYPNMASRWGKMGGRPKKLDIFQLGGLMVKDKKEDAGPPSATPPPPRQ
jgi:hypothetical protein